MRVLSFNHGDPILEVDEYVMKVESENPSLYITDLTGDAIAATIKASADGTHYFDVDTFSAAGLIEIPGRVMFLMLDVTTLTETPEVIDDSDPENPVVTEEAIPASFIAKLVAG